MSVCPWMSVQSDKSSEMTTSTVMAVRLYSPVVVLCLVFKIYAEGVCDADITVPQREKKVCVGDSFNLSCQFLCLSQSHRLQLLHNHQLLRDENFTTPDSTLHYYVAFASSEHNGTYYCRTEPRDAVSPNFFIYINDTCKDVENNSEVKPMENVKIGTSYFLLILYLLCKAGAVLLFVMFAVLPNCHIR